MVTNLYFIFSILGLGYLYENGCMTRRQGRSTGPSVVVYEFMI